MLTQCSRKLLNQLMLLVTVLFCFVVSSPIGSASPALDGTCRCQGCGCRGGPCWRINRTDQCASNVNLARECGDPPENTLCIPERVAQICPSERACGRKGGPGWRDKNGHCVTWNRL